MRERGEAFGKNNGVAHWNEHLIDYMLFTEVPFMSSLIVAERLHGPNFLSEHTTVRSFS
jgi:hypothetical protein